MLRTLKSRDWFLAGGVAIAVERREPQEPFPRHKHEFSEIVVVTGGKGEHRVGKQALVLSAGDVFVIGGPQAHEYRNLENLRLINVLFQPENMKLEHADLGRLPGYHALFRLEPLWRKRHQFESRLRLTPRELGAVVELIEQLEGELRERSAGFGFLATAYFMQIVGMLSRLYGRTRGADSRHLLNIASAITHLESNSSEEVNLDHLARIAHMSKRSLVRAFRAATGVPPIAYLIQLRINRAAGMLRASSEGITEIAFRAGFADSNYFSRQFRQVTGVSPRRYRETHGGAWGR